jgi:hypothetical protein
MATVTIYVLVIGFVASNIVATCWMRRRTGRKLDEIEAILGRIDHTLDRMD